MPPAQKKETGAERDSMLKKGSLVSVETSGRTQSGLEVLDFDDKFIKLRWNPAFPPNTETVLVPWDRFVIGLDGER